MQKRQDRFINLVFVVLHAACVNLFSAGVKHYSKWGHRTGQAFVQAGSTGSLLSARERIDFLFRFLLRDDTNKFECYYHDRAL